MDNYQESFGRNIGVVTEEEQLKLKNARIGVAGLGGIGGAALLCLARMGVGKYNLADLDHFDVANLNRQVGANHQTFGKAKVDVMKEQTLSINPEAEITTFPQGVTPKNAAEFVQNVDVVVDSIEYFTISARETLHRAAYEAKKPVVFAAPLGFSAAFLSFTPDGMHFCEYFNISEHMDPFEKLLRFTVGMSPSVLHLKYMEFSKEQLTEMQTGPSFATSVNLGAALIGVEVMCLITGKRKAQSAPQYTQIDLLTGKQVRRRLIWGNRGPIQRLKILFARKKYGDFRELFLKFIN